MDFLHLFEENLSSMDLGKKKDLLQINSQRHTPNRSRREQEEVEQDQNQRIREVFNKIQFRNVFKIKDQKYDRIIEQAYLTTLKVQNIVQDNQELQSSLEIEKQQVYYVFEKLIHRYYSKHHEKKEQVKEFMIKMKRLNEEIRYIKEEQKDLKEKKEKLQENRKDSNNSIDEYKKMIESNK
mmetsp:Transcript_9208/g.8611  ORF Transcript_9208/g.8611 Transcript_9208/m.8611 type:complete len:181 (+) Transcript_9208:181-723(+)